LDHCLQFDGRREDVRMNRSWGRRLWKLTLALVVTGGLGLVACGDGGDTDPPAAGTETTTPSANGGSGAPAAMVELDALAAASGDAPATAGAGLDEPPGEPERVATVEGVGEVAASVTAADGTVTGCCLLVASTDAQRQRGLMEVTDLGGYQGMVFVFDQDEAGGFWMRNTPTPLSIAWFEADGDFVSATDMAPCSDDEPDCPVYPPEGSYRFAVEVFEGDLDALGVGPGSRLRLGGECAAAS
jgi:uncharacterized membrane protein (UPF0127 family)